MIDVCRDPRWGRVAEGAGEDPLLGSLIAQAKVKGLQTINPETGYPYVAACFKHYCGYGLSQGGRDYEECDASPRTLFMDYMKPYQAAVDAGAFSAMSSFNVLNGEPVSGSHYYLTEILREKYGFQGAVVSDYDAVKELIHHRVVANRHDAGAKSIVAGVDIDMGSHVYSENLEALYHEDPRFAAAIDESVRRVLSVKFALGLFENPYHEEDAAEKYINKDEYKELSREIARHCIVLLKNEDKTLPLSTKKKYFLTGPLSANEEDMPGCWAGYNPWTNVYSVKKAMEEAGYDFEHCNGITFNGKYCFHDNNDSEFETALAKATECDEIIYVCGERASWSGENRGRVSIDLPENQYRYLRALKATGKKIISVLMTGRSMAVAELAETSDALVLGWHLGTEAGRAVCDILFGSHSPSGRLPITFPYHTGQVPYYHAWLSSGRSRTELARYKDCNNDPLYVFGYGLSYADITYSNLRLDQSTITDQDLLVARVTLTNHSDIDSYEVVQAYFQDVVSSLATPERKLCGFEKVLVPAHESVDVTLEIPAERFAMMTNDLREVVEPGDFILYVGHDSSCQDAIAFVVE
jgi:beta-glucosidase